MPRKLHIGGQVRTEGWEVLDVNPGPDVDHVSNAADMRCFADNTFDQVYASHVLEHFDYTGALLAALKEWNRIMVPGATLCVSVPDLDVLARLFLDRRSLSYAERFLVMRMIFGGHVDQHDYHLVGLNEEFLSDLLRMAGFMGIRKVPAFGFFKDTSSLTMNDTPISLNLTCEKPVSNQPSAPAMPPPTARPSTSAPRLETSHHPTKFPSSVPNHAGNPVAAQATSMAPLSVPVTGLYVDLLKKCLMDSIYDDGLDMMRGGFSIDPNSGKAYSSQAVSAAAEDKRLGLLWPSRAHTMIGMVRLDNLQFCVETVLKEAVSGDFIEGGVWRGGAAIFMRGLLKAHGVCDRRVWVADSFMGLPEPDPVRYPQDQVSGTDTPFHLMGDLAVSLEEVRQNFSRYGLLDEQVRFLPGWFRDTLPTAPITSLAIMRLDGDMYESTMDGLTHLYPKLQVGGFAIIDDYNMVPACNAAVEDYRSARGITDPLIALEGCGAFWRKTIA